MILVVDSTDRERLTITKDELNKMLDCDVSINCCSFTSRKLFENLHLDPLFFSQTKYFFLVTLLLKNIELSASDNSHLTKVVISGPFDLHNDFALERQYG